MGARSIHVRLQPEDYVCAQALHTRWTRKRVIVFAAIAATGVALLLLRQEWSMILGGGLAGGAIGGVVAQEIVRRVLLPRRSRRWFAQQKSLQREVVFEWDGQGLAWSADNGSGKTPWRDYLKWRANERILLLYHSDLLFQMIPLRAFASPPQVDDFIACLGRRED